jgi:hypothetical protein
LAHSFAKQPSSRIIKQQNFAWTGTGTLLSTPFASATQQVRVFSQVGGQFCIDNLGTVPTTPGGTGTLIAPNTFEYYAVTSGMLFSFSSTSTSSGSVNCTETA